MVRELLSFKCISFIECEPEHSSVSALLCTASKTNSAGKTREELALEKQMELERRLMDVSGQLNSGKKPVKAKRKSIFCLY